MIVAALLIAPLSSYLSNGHRGRDPNFIDRALLGLSWPVQASLTGVVQQSVALVQGYIALRGAHDEALACEARLAEAHAERNALREAAAENVRLKQALGYVEGSVDSEIMARIIGLNPSAQFLSVRIDRGENDGVRVGMPVVTPEGVLGQVVRATGGSADVMLLTDQASRVGAVIQRTRRRATVTGSGDGRELTLDFVRRE
ncbi:MAG: rod shape-determining protein MreC, partial [Archangium sp.]|nr:rod shape-determining protein MreC [Archangium sp.]